MCVVCCVYCFFFFFKQKTAYEMRISDWSSDVCSSDLRDIQTYEWAAAHVEMLGGEVARLRPRLVIANMKRWTARELDLRREAASASELGEAMEAMPGYRVPAIDWDRTTGKVMTMEWIDGVKISDRDALIAAGHDVKEIAARLVNAFLRQSIAEIGRAHI